MLMKGPQVPPEGMNGGPWQLLNLKKNLLEQFLSFPSLSILFLCKYRDNRCFKQERLLVAS